MMQTDCVTEENEGPAIEVWTLRFSKCFLPSKLEELAELLGVRAAFHKIWSAGRGLEPPTSTMYSRTAWNSFA